MEGENRLLEDPERNEIDAFGNFVCRFGTEACFGGEKRQRLSAPTTPRRRRSSACARRIVTRLPAEAGEGGEGPKLGFGVRGGAPFARVEPDPPLRRGASTCAACCCQTSAWAHDAVKRPERNYGRFGLNGQRSADRWQLGPVAIRMVRRLFEDTSEASLGQTLLPVGSGNGCASGIGEHSVLLPQERRCSCTCTLPVRPASKPRGKHPMSKRHTRRPQDVRSPTSAGDHRDLTFDWSSETQSLRFSASARSLRWFFWLIVVLLPLLGWPKPAIAFVSNLGLPSLSHSLPVASTVLPPEPSYAPAAHGPHHRHASPLSPAAHHRASCAAGH